MIKKGIITTLLILSSFFFIGVANAEVVTETLKEACDAEELTCDFEEKEPSEDLPNIYIFRGNGCGYCERLLTFLGTIAEEYQDKVNFVVYEVADNTDNWDLYEKVGAKFGDEVSGYPYMVIGTKVFNGYASSDDEEIIETIEEYAAEENPYDVVAEVESGNLDEVKIETENNATAIVLVFIFGVVIVLIVFAGYIINKKESKTIKKTKNA